MRDLLATQRYVLLNFLPLVQGGPWTWVDRSNPGVRSCLDLAIVSAGLQPFINTVVVDREQEFTPRRVRRTRKGITSTYSDHYALEVEFVGLPRAGRREVEQEEERCTWNFKKAGGWERYAEETSAVAEMVAEIIEDETLTIEECMRRVNKVNDKVKFGAF